METPNSAWRPSLLDGLSKRRECSDRPIRAAMTTGARSACYGVTDVLPRLLIPRRREVCGEISPEGPDADLAIARMEQGVKNDIAEAFIPELVNLKDVYPIVFAGGGKGTDSLTRAGISLARYPGREHTVVMALDLDTLKAAEKERLILLEKHDKLHSNEPHHTIIHRILNKPIQYASLYQFRETPESSLTIELSGHGAAGFKGLGQTSLNELIDGLVKSGVQTGDSIFLSSCFGADSTVVRKTNNVDRLDKSARGKRSIFGHSTPLARALLNGLYERGICVTVYANHYGRNVFSRRKGGPLGSANQEPLITQKDEILGPVHKFVRKFTIEGVSRMGHSGLPKQFM